ncbi:MAG: ATP-binding protein [Mariprofundaceae bacterium]|nr:ATP-binding protein [Mariprofundaceae bacterium]
MSKFRTLAGKLRRLVIKLRVQQGIWAYFTMLLIISELLTLPTVAAFDLWFKGRIMPVDLLIAALVSPIVTALIVTIINPFVEYIFRMEARLKITQNLTGIGSWEWTVADDHVDYSGKASYILGLNTIPSEQGFAPLLALVEEKNRPAVDDWITTLKSGKTPARIEFCIRHFGADTRMLRMEGALLHDNKGCLCGGIGTLQDVSERAAAVTGRQQAELTTRNFMAAIEQAQDAILLIHVDGLIEYVNKATSVISGYKRDELVGKIAYFMRPGVCSQPPFDDILKQVRNGHSWHGHIKDRRRDGAIYPAYGFISPIVDEHGIVTRYVCSQQDLSEKETLEQQLEQAQKMEAIGTLVGGIAHDFNNMLAGITSNLFLARTMAADNAQLLEKLQRADALCFRSADMIKQLLAFARKDRVEMKNIAVNSFLKEAMKLHTSTIPENIRVVFNPCAGQVVINGDAVQLQQILLNLLNNACHALRYTDDPRIVIRTKIIEADNAFLAQHPEAKAMPYLCLSVVDNGCGIDNAAQPRIFDPFFTTKEVGEGSGLGLSMVYGAVKRHHGFIHVQSREDEGTNFYIYLPVSGMPRSEEELLASCDEEIKRGHGETVLLVDDEANFLAAHKDVLTAIGYRCITANNGYEALNTFAEDPLAIDLVLTDVVMPEIGGLEAAGRMRRIRQDVPILFTTGYESGGGRETSIDSQEIVLIKPFSIAELSRALHRQLDA